MFNPTAGPRRNGRRNGRGPALLILLALLGLLPACGRALMDPDKPRSQFDRFDAIREQRSPSTVDDEFGMRRINVRGRLLPKD
jgi:hypothetical protein